MKLENFLSNKLYKQYIQNYCQRQICHKYNSILYLQTILRVLDSCFIVLRHDFSGVVSCFRNRSEISFCTFQKLATGSKFHLLVSCPRKKYCLYWAELLLFINQALTLVVTTSPEFMCLSHINVGVERETTKINSCSYTLYP